MSDFTLLMASIVAGLLTGGAIAMAKAAISSH